MRFSNAVALAVIAAFVTPSEAHAIPAWARKYNMNCSGCHYPAPPRLNAAGLRFRWAGYRMPEEIGEAATVTQISNYISARGQVAFNFQKQTGQSAETAFDAEEATLFYGGPFGKNFTGWFEFERGTGGEFGLASQVGGVWGGEHSYRGFKVGMGHWLENVGIAGFDRMVGFSQPLPLEGPVTAVKNVVQLKTGVLGVVPPLRIPYPLTVGERGEPVVGLVEATNFARVKGTAQHEEPPQVELVVIEGCGRSHRRYLAAATTGLSSEAAGSPGTRPGSHRARSRCCGSLVGVCTVRSLAK